MPDLSDGEFAEVMERVLADAESRANMAVFTGAHHDNGAEHMRAEVEMFRLGMNRRLPNSWLPYVREMRLEEDPEWGEYQRLKQKFEP